MSMGEEPVREERKKRGIYAENNCHRSVYFEKCF